VRRIQFYRSECRAGDQLTTRKVRGSITSVSTTASVRTTRAAPGAIVALGLVGGATGFGDAFTLFALVILPIVLFIGVATFMRLGVANYHEAMCVIGMNRIRAAYLELAPDLEGYFVMSAHDDRRRIGITMGVQPGGTISWIGQIIAGTPTAVMILNSALAGAIAAIAALRMRAAPTLILVAAARGFLVALALQGWYAAQTIAKAQAGYRPAVSDA
jgi:hypothetical protein